MSDRGVPRMARALLRAILHPEDRRFALADLEEDFERRARRLGPGAARHWYRAQVARSIGPTLASRVARLPRSIIGDLCDDVRFALRTLAKSPMVAIVTVLSLAVGIAAATSVFTAANAFLMRPLSQSITEPTTLASVYTTEGDGERYGATSFPVYLDVREQVDAFADTAAVRMGVLQIDDDSQPRRIIAEIVTGNYFRLLGITLPIGRAFLPEESRVGSAEPIVVISDHLWRTRFEAAPDVVGRTIDLDGKPFTVIGVAPADLTSRMLALKIAVWVPLGIPGGTYHSDEGELADRADREHMIVARMRDGVSSEQAQLDVLSDRLYRQYPESWKDDRDRPLGLSVIPASEGTLPPDWMTALAGFSGIVMLAAGLILAVACFNVASLFLARASRRSREMAVRLALGAQRRRLITMLLTESLLLGLVAGALGVFLSTRAMRWIDSVTLPIGDLSMEFDFSLDHRVLLFGILLSVATSVVFGLAPAIEGSRPSLLPALQGATTAPKGRRRRIGLRHLLVVGQVATALIFVVGAAVTLRSFDALTEADWGVEPDRIAMMSKRLPDEVGEDAFVPYYRDLIARLEAHPEVEEAQLALAAEAGVFAPDNMAQIRVEGYERAEGESLTVPINAVTPGYLEMVGIRLARGRTIASTDVQGAARAALVTEAFVRRFWGDGEGIGRGFSVVGRYEIGDPVPDLNENYEIVGVVEDARYQGFESNGRMYVWTALYQSPGPRVMLLLKGRTSADAMVQVLRGEIDPTDRELALVTPQAYEDLISFQFGFLIYMGQVLGWAGAFGLALATIGIYGTVSFAVSRRAKELAIRQAVGALPGQVARSVLREGLVLSAWGLAVGLLIVLPLGALLRADIEGMSPVDPVSTVVGAGILMLVALGASFVPARRVMRLDPVATLRED